MSDFTEGTTGVTRLGSFDLRDARDLRDDPEAAARARFDAEWIDEEPIPKIVSEYERLTRVRPKDAEVHFKYGTRFLELGRGLERRAIEAFSIAVSLKPDSADAHYHLGLAYTAGGRNRKAIEAYKAALELQPNDRDILTALLLAQRSTGDLPDVVQRLRSLPDDKPTNMDDEPPDVKLLPDTLAVRE